MLYIYHPVFTRCQLPNTLTSPFHTSFSFDMKFSIFALVGAASQLVAASPIDAEASIEIRMEDSAPLESRQPASGCWNA